MNILIDMAGVALILVNVLLGLRFGLLRRLFVAAGVYAGVAVASFTGNAFVGWFYGTGRPGALFADAWAFVIVLGAVVLGAELLGYLYNDKIKSVATLMFDRTVGAGVGAALGVVQIAIVCFVLLSAGSVHDPGDGSLNLPGDRSSVADSVRASFVGGRVNSAENAIQTTFRLVLPQDMPGHLADSTKNEQGSTRAAR